MTETQNRASINEMEETSEMSLLDYWNFFMKYKWIIIGIAAAVSIGAIIYALVVTPIYKASLVMAPIQEEEAGGLSSLMSRYSGLAAMAGISAKGKGVAKADENLAILKSRAFITEFIKKEKLMPVLFSDVWDEENKQWKVEPEDAPTMADAYELFNAILNVGSNRETQIITLTVDWKDSVLASEWANKLVDRLNLYIKNQQVRDAQKNLDFLTHQLNTTNKAEDRTILYELIESNTKTIMLANVTDEFAFKVLDPAVVPEKKDKPRRRMIVLIGGMLGLGLGIVVAFGYNYLMELKKET